jgi:succinate dehydrogenase flavin-adding protein (antitoxin of CptAB toxin-antitoxin module)
MDVPDPQLFAWITGDEPVPQDQDTALFRRLRAFDGAAKSADR